MEAASVDSIVTDPPYGLSKEPDIREVLQHWLRGDHYEHNGQGFMGREWDSFVPGPEYWREAFRVLKPGGHLVAFSGTRTFDLLSIAIRLAGFEIRDDITTIGSSRLLWVYGQGMPKSTDMSRIIDRAEGVTPKVIGVEDRRSEYDGHVRTSVAMNTQWRVKEAREDVRNVALREITEPTTEKAKQWSGWSTSLKPSHEPILLARKPLDGTVVHNVMQYGTGALNTNGCRVRFGGPGDEAEAKNKNRHLDFHSGLRDNSVYGKDTASREKYGNWNPSGRWPSNIILLHQPGCVNNGPKQVGSDGHWPNGQLTGYGHGIGQGDYAYQGPGVQSKMEWKEDWTCAEGCPVAELDRQTSHLQPAKGAYARKSGDRIFFGTMGDGKTDPPDGRSDVGGASRFFSQFAGVDSSSDFLYVPKASRSERDEGLPECHHYDGQKTEKNYDGIPHKCPICGGYPFGNTHPTIKPIALCRWLVRLVTPPNGTVLDPFSGSGSIGIAARLEGFGYIGIDREHEYVDIAVHRLAHHGAVHAVMEKKLNEQRTLF
jgi:hypothetical protein